ncbi:hypothetical protein Rfer_3063 [Rhodoferax ferrireducens T118]|uniref:Uncharacterized protein n=1 Tax=Albidiferax ferrireducens (strain ATCC BAA-621 / DSM 15236 / T118) TaxID=338969 RepID=Q21TY0_ALBFT|nr:hypothetical protein [Rhodoferax ferrireducens]ABD70773.1 hypothetical protein Rfer_3063 [Rhodoferax ferrireducens T118]
MNTEINTPALALAGTETRTLYVEVDQLEAFKKQLDKLNETAEVAGIPPIKITADHTTSLPAAPGEAAMLVAVLTLDYPVVELGDWAVVGRLEAPKESVARKLFAFDYSKKEADTVALLAKTGHPLECEHCRANRRRVESYLLRNRTTGEYKQVGSGCLDAFTGGSSGAAISLASLSKFVAKWNEKLLKSRRGTKLFAVDVRQYLADLFFTLGSYEYRLLRDCSTEKMTTHYKALDVPALIASLGCVDPADAVRLNEIYAEDKERNLALADAFRAAYARKTIIEGTFEHNVNVVLREDLISLFRTRPLNVVCAAAHGFMLDQLRKVMGAGAHVGKRNQHFSKKLTVVAMQHQAHFGRDVYLKDSDGNVFVAETNDMDCCDESMIKHRAEVGTVLDLEFKIVGHRKLYSTAYTSIKTAGQAAAEAAADAAIEAHYGV